MSGHCKGCGVFHEEDDSRLCTACESEKKVRLCKHDLEVSPSGKLALCRKCPFVGVWRDGMWERAGDGAARVQVTQWLRDNERQSKSLGLLDQAALFEQAADVIEGFLKYAQMWDVCLRARGRKEMRAACAALGIDCPEDGQAIGPHADIERARVVRMAQRIAGAHNP